MLMHSNIPANQWNQVKGEIQKTWNKLNAAELEGTQGDVRQISSLVQKRYGLKSDQVDQKIDECIDRCGTSAGPASFDNPYAASAGPADLGSNVDPSSLSASINQNSSGEVHSRSFEAPEEGMDSADSMHASWNEGADEAPEDFEFNSNVNMDVHSQRDSRAAEDVTKNEPKRYGSKKGEFNDDSEFEEGQSRNSETGNSRGSQALEKSAGNSGGPETFEKSARNNQGSAISRSNARDRQSSSAQNSRSSEDSSEAE